MVLGELTLFPHWPLDSISHNLALSMHAAQLIHIPVRTPPIPRHSQERTPLHLAAAAGHAEVVCELLLQVRGAGFR